MARREETIASRRWPRKHEDALEYWWDKDRGGIMCHWTVYMQLDGKVRLIKSNGSGVGKDKRTLAQATARVLTPSDLVYSKKRIGLWWVCECWARNKDHAIAITTACAEAMTQTTTWIEDYAYTTDEMEYVSTLHADKEEAWW